MKKVVLQSDVLPVADAGELEHVGFATIDSSGDCRLLVEGSGRYGWRLIGRLAFALISQETFGYRKTALREAIGRGWIVYVITNDADLLEVLNVAKSG